MKHFFLFAGSIFLCFQVAFAQPQFKLSSYVPEIGDSIKNVRHTKPTVFGGWGPLDTLGGLNRTWIYSQLDNYPNKDTNLFVCLDPAQTPWGNQFPTADMAFQQDYTLVATGDQLVNHTYVNVTDSNLVRLGTGSSASSIFAAGSTVYTEPHTWFTFPMNYGDTLRDQYEFTSNGNPRTFQYRLTYDGVGTLVLPWGTLFEVMLFKAYYYRPGGGVQGGDFIRLEYLWMKDGYDLPVLKLSERNEEFVFANYIEYSTPQELEPSTSIRTGDFAGAAMQLFPNPAQEWVHLKLDLPQSLEAALVLENQLGQAVRQFQQGIFLAGTQEMELDLSSIPAGIYFLSVRGTGGVLRQKLVIR